MTEFLLRTPLLLLFCIAGFGYLLGQIRIAGVSMGVASVLFVGLAFGALDPKMGLPPLVDQLGLVLFVYTMGLSSGPSFFRSFRKDGAQANLLVAAAIGCAFVAARLARALLGLSGAVTAGLFAGSLTNTPALAAVLDAMGQRGAEAADRSLPVVGYSLTYPAGVLGMLGALVVFRRLTVRLPQPDERAALERAGLIRAPLVSRSVRIERVDAVQVPVHTLVDALALHVVFGRMLRNQRLEIVVGRTEFELGDIVSVIGTTPDTDIAIRSLGVETPAALDLDRHDLDFRRVFVSNAELIGQHLGDLHLSHRFGALVTRVRRGDVDLMADPQLVLEPGDRVRVVAPRARLAEVSRYFGDSIRAISEIDVMAASVGMGLGILIGSLSIPLPGGGRFALGSAAGTLLVALVLGRLGRLGPVQWHLPFSANLTLRQLGMVLFLAGVGSRAGFELREVLAAGGGWPILLSGSAITLAAALLVLSIGHRWLRIAPSQLAGVLAGMQTQPAVLAFASAQHQDELPELGYAAVYPVAMLTKIILARLLL